MTSQALSPSRLDAVRGTVRNELAQPPPREVPRQLWVAARHPVATFLMWFGLGMGVPMAGVLAVAISFRPPSSIFMGVIVAAVFLQMPVMVARGWWSRRRTWQILEAGTACKARVLYVKPTIGYINGRSFSKVGLEVATGAGAAQAQDVTDNTAVDLFFNARDENREIEVIWSEKHPGHAIALDRLALMNRWD